MRWLSFLFWVMFLSGCTTVGRDKTAALGPEKRIAILSAVGNSFNFTSVGTLSRASEVVDVPAWNLDNVIASTLAKLIADKQRFKVVAWNPTQARPQVVLNGFGGGSVENGPAISNASAAMGADLLRVIYPAVFTN